MKLDIGEFYENVTRKSKFGQKRKNVGKMCEDTNISLSLTLILFVSSLASQVPFRLIFRNKLSAGSSSHFIYSFYT
jgi:hypothetical protein